MSARELVACACHGCALTGPVTKFFRPVCEPREKAAWPNFWLWNGLSECHISTRSCVETGLTERNCLTNRTQKNFATGPAIAPSAKAVAFGDFSRYYIRRITGAKVLRLVERYADYNQTGFVAFQRWDGALIDVGTHPVKYLAMHS